MFGLPTASPQVSEDHTFFDEKGKQVRGRSSEDNIHNPHYDSGTLAFRFPSGCSYTPLLQFTAVHSGSIVFNLRNFHSARVSLNNGVFIAKVGVGRSNRLARSSFQNAKALI
jgi:hypothetical protein